MHGGGQAARGGAVQAARRRRDHRRGRGRCWRWRTARSRRRSAWCSRCARTSTRCARRGCSRVSEQRVGAALTGKLVHLSAAVRAGGVRVGVGELLAAHRALQRDRRLATGVETYLALRAVLCSRQEDLEPFDAAFVEVFAGRAEYPEQPEVLDDIADLVLPSVAVPPQRRVAPPARDRGGGGGARGVVGHRAAPAQGLRRVHRRRPPDGARRDGPPGRPGPAPAQPPHAPLAPHRPAAAGRARRPARHGAGVAALPAASRSSATGASRASGPGRWCWCATSRARWSPTRGCCSCTCRPAWPRAGGSRRSRSAPA